MHRKKYTVFIVLQNCFLMCIVSEYCNGRLTGAYFATALYPQLSITGSNTESNTFIFFSCGFVNITCT